MNYAQVPATGLIIARGFVGLPRQVAAGVGQGSVFICFAPIVHLYIQSQET